MDALAKQAAEQVCNLGLITFVAYNHKVERLGEDGKMHTATLRDSQDAPKKKRQR